MDEKLTPALARRLAASSASAGIALSLFLLSAAPARPQADGLTLLAHFDPGRGGYADVWGYVGPTGREYALLNVRTGGGLSVIDVTDAVPVEEAYIRGSGGSSDVEVYGHYAYVTSDYGPTLIVDLEDPENPVLLGTFGSATHTLSIAGGYLYANGGTLRIYSLADPEAPVLIGTYSPHYVHDVLVRGDTMYTAAVYGQGIDIVDISDRANPTRIERFNYPDSGAHNVCSDASGSYLYVGDEIGAGPWTRIFDVRDPHNVALVGEIIVDPASVVHNCHVKDGLLYIAHYDRGAWVFDISDPANPVQVAFYEEGIISHGFWTVFPHLPSGKILASAWQDGLYVLRLDGAVANEPGSPGPPSGTHALSAPVPNPTTGRTEVTLAVSQAQAVTVAVFDALGRRVAVLHEGTLAAGEMHRLAFDGSALPTGIYAVRALGETFADTRVLTLTR